MERKIKNDRTAKLAGCVEGPPSFLQTHLLGHLRLDGHDRHAKTYPWYRVIWLTGVDYFSTIAYQPGIALLAAGALSPIATIVLILVTLFGAVPTYAQVAKRSFAGQGSIAMLEHLLSGWAGKISVLVLLGFAATDFVITMTLSAADAAQHAVENPLLHPYVGDSHVGLTLVLLALLAFVFLRGFTEAISIATLIAVPYLGLNFIVLVAGLIRIIGEPSLVNNWWSHIWHIGDVTQIVILSAFIFPRLALGMSGFETAVSTMPLIKTSEGKDHINDRVKATKKLLVVAAAIMCVMLILSSFVTTVLLTPAQYGVDGPANGRALSFICHNLLGEWMGSIYDLFTILILWFAGASAMTGLLTLIPRYLPRFGMAPTWVTYSRPLVLLLFLVNVVVTWVFDASVDAQASAYATGVLVLMLSAAVAVALTLWREAMADEANKIHTAVLSLVFWALSAVFLYTLVDNVIHRIDGLIIASIFIFAILISSFVSRYVRAKEMRISSLQLLTPRTQKLWNQASLQRVVLVPIRKKGTAAVLEEKKEQVKKYFAIANPIAFLHIELMDNRSEFLAEPQVQISMVDEDYYIEIIGANSIANTIAYVSELLHPGKVIVDLTRQNLMTQAIRFLIWGEGETGLLLYQILIRYWERREGEFRPLIFLMSD